MAPDTFALHHFAGSHRAIGEQYGVACAELIHRHRDLALARLGDKAGVSREAALRRALDYRPWVQRYAPFFDEEIVGLADAASISLAEAYLLQLRAELATPLNAAPVAAAPSVGGEAGDECTSFAALPRATADGVALIGQNADLPAFYGDIAIMAEIVPDDAPAVLMLLSAGQVSYIGINDRGLGCFANFLTCDGWRMGLPRYFFSRLALTQATVDDALTVLRRVERASSRNLIMLDTQGDGHAAALETTPTADARLDPADGLLAHANHYTAPALLGEERSPARYVANSSARQARMEHLLRENHGRLDVAMMQAILRDRACHPDNLSRAAGDLDTDVITFASVIAEPSRRQMWVAVGPPHEHEYVRYAFGN